MLRGIREVGGRERRTSRSRVIARTPSRSPRERDIVATGKYFTGRNDKEEKTSVQSRVEPLRPGEGCYYVLLSESIRTRVGRL